MSFSEKQLELTITLGTGTFGAQLGNTVTLSGLRMFADMAAPCGDSMGTLQLRVFGLTQSMMNQLTTIGTFGQVKDKNTILLAAGDDNGMSTIFQGAIWQAWADYAAMPEVVFNIIAYVGMDLALKPVDALSYPGSADVGQIMASMAKTANLSFVNQGVSVQLQNPYFHGTIWQQIKMCAAAARINQKIELGTLTIWPQGGSISGSVPDISPSTGMVGYPALSSQGMTIKTIFNPGIILGGLVQVKSSLPMATGKFNVFNYAHNLSCQAPGGPWFTIFDCIPA